MGSIRLGVLGPADIARRRFVPALKQTDKIEFAGIAIRREESRKKAETIFEETHTAADIYSSYDEMLDDKSVDAVYIPLPPSLHFEWGKKALECGKHVFMEKPFCINEKETAELINIAKEKGLVLYENYGCLLHDQTKIIDKMVKDGRIGRLSLIRAAFGFPYRGENDFRYDASLGGGALLDAGGYCMKIARHYMDEDACVKYAKLFYGDRHDCDMFGSVVMEDKSSLTAQLSFGMDNQYRCELELWGEKGTILAPRIFTAPAALAPEIIVTNGMEKETIKAKPTDQFLAGINDFADMISKCDTEKIHKKMDEIYTGSKDVSEVFRLDKDQNE